MLLLEQPAEGGGADHVGRAGIWVLAVNDHANEAGIGFGDALDGVFGAQAFGAAVQNTDSEPFGAAALGQQERPGGRFDGGEILAQGLVGLKGGIRADK